MPSYRGETLATFYVTAEDDPQAERVDVVSYAHFIGTPDGPWFTADDGPWWTVRKYRDHEQAGTYDGYRNVVVSYFYNATDAMAHAIEQTGWGIVAVTVCQNLGLEVDADG